MKKVLLIAHCGSDTARIQRVLDSFGAVFEGAFNMQGGLDKLRSGGFDLVLPNRVFGYDDEGGINFIKAMQEDPELKKIPVMLVSGYEDYQERAVAAGAVRVAESEKSGMSYGKNFGAAQAENDFFIFIDADTILRPGSIDSYIRRIARKASDPSRIIGTVAGAPEKGGLVVKTCFHIANCATARKQVHAPGGVMLMNRSVFSDIKGFNESLPQGTSTDLILRAKEAGAEYIYIPRPRAITSIRRFEKRGIIPQMLDWRRNHRDMQRGEHSKVEKKDYKVIR